MLTIGTIFTDRDYLLKGWLDSLEAFAIDKQDVNLVWVDNTAREYSWAVRTAWLAGHEAEYASVKTVSSEEPVYGHVAVISPPGGVERMEILRKRNISIARNYNLIRSWFLSSEDEYLFLYEDDVIAPSHTINWLLPAVQQDNCGIAFGWIAHYSADLQGKPGVVQCLRLVETFPGEGPELAEYSNANVKEGVEGVTAGAIGMVLIRREVMEALEFKPNIGNLWGVDTVLGYEANQAGWTVCVHWGLRGKHIVEF